VKTPGTWSKETETGGSLLLSPAPPGVNPTHETASPRLQRLSAHLAISHSVPVLLVTVALGLTLIALVRISVVLTTLNDSELTALGSEGMLHRRAWALDVAMRHAHAACVSGTPRPDLVRRIDQERTTLRSLLEGEAPRRMHELALGYVQAADGVLSGDPCGRLLDPSFYRRRAELDEQLTNVWVDRLRELHTAVALKEREAKSIAVSATWIGIPLATLSLLLAILTAHRMARTVRIPLERLSEWAQNVGRGDFRTRVTIRGPAEVRSLADSLDRMRGQLQQLDSLKQGFLASVSHELRTPLSKIRESLALMEDGAVGTFEPRQGRVIQIARSACERQIRFVTTLLDLSRLRAGSPIRIREATTIDAVLQAAIEDERVDAAGRNVRIETRLHGPVVGSAMDPVLMERAIANLIRNAVSVSKPGQRVLVERDVATRAAAEGGAFARVSVTDEGPGVPSEVRDTLFRPFVTHPITNSARTLGVGLGLALAREVAQAHGGDLELLPDSSRGTTFQLWIPIDAAAPPQRGSDRDAQSPQHDLQGAP
jgi:two-component system sensor histidine kinase GlrK